MQNYLFNQESAKFTATAVNKHFFTNSVLPNGDYNVIVTFNDEYLEIFSSENNIDASVRFINNEMNAEHIDCMIIKAKCDDISATDYQKNRSYIEKMSERVFPSFSENRHYIRTLWNMTDDISWEHFLCAAAALVRPYEFDFETVLRYRSECYNWFDSIFDFEINSTRAWKIFQREKKNMPILAKIWMRNEYGPCKHGFKMLFFEYRD